MENNVLVERGAVTRVGMFPTTTADDVGKTVVVESTDEKGIPNFKYSDSKIVGVSYEKDDGSVYISFNALLINDELYLPEYTTVTGYIVQSNIKCPIIFARYTQSGMAFSVRYRSGDSDLTSIVPIFKETVTIHEYDQLICDTPSN